MIDITQSALDFEQEDPTDPDVQAYVSAMRATRVNPAHVTQTLPSWWAAGGGAPRKAPPAAAQVLQRVASRVGESLADAALSAEAVEPILVTFTTPA